MHEPSAIEDRATHLGDASQATGTRKDSEPRWPEATRPLSSLRRIGFAVVIAAVLARSFAILYWPDMFFDGDQAVVGFMAKHLAEGRAFPVFQYSLSYVLMLESWLIAPLFTMAEASVALVKSVPVALNVLTAVLLYGSLTSTSSLRPLVGLVAVAPFALPGPVSASNLSDALGMCIEPLVFALLLWRWRDRPIALGITAALAVRNREFALYALAALLAIDLLRERSLAFWRKRVVALIAFAVIWWGVQLLTQFSSPAGPGTTYSMAGGVGSNLSVAASAACIDPSLIPKDLQVTFGELLPLQFGLTTRPLFYPQPFNVPWFWLPLVAVLSLAVLRGVWRAWREGPTPITWFGLFLVLIGVQAVLAYALTRCGNSSYNTMRYILMASLAPTGALALGFDRERFAGLHWLLIGVVTFWTTVCGLNHAFQIRDYVASAPQRGYRLLANYLETRQVRFLVTDYWTGYHVAFLTNERIKALTTFDRIKEHVWDVTANLEHAVQVRRRREEAPCPDPVEIAGFYVCPPNTPLP